MVSILQKFVVPIFRYCNCQSHCYWRSTTQVEALGRFNQYSLMFHTLLIQRSSFVLIILQVTIMSTSGMEIYNNHFTTIMQGCYNSARMRALFTNFLNLVTTLLQPYKVGARLLQSSYFCIGKYHSTHSSDWHNSYGFLNAFVMLHFH